MVSRARADARYEIKMACQEAAYEHVRTVLSMDPAALRTLHPSRRVQSLYLDTPTGTALEENLAGISHREKIRLRWYGDEGHGVAATLERKVRENALGWKDTFRLPGTIDVEGVPRWTFMQRLGELAAPNWRAALQNCLEPVQWITYLRDYLRTADGRVRVTVDRELRAADQRFEPALTSRRRTALPRICVVEAKCAPDDYDAAQSLLARLPLFVDRCSKFVLASDRAHGPVPSMFPL